MSDSSAIFQAFQNSANIYLYMKSRTDLENTRWISSIVALFLPARRYASAGLCDSDVSVCLSVRHTPVLCLAERKQDREMYTIG